MLMRSCLLLLALPAITPPLNGAPPALQALPEGDTGIAAKYPGDQGIARDPAVLFHDDFETGTVQGKWDNTFQNHLIRMATEPGNFHGGKRALEFTVPKQKKELSNAVVKNFKKGQDVLFMRYYSKFDKGFDQVGSSHNGGTIYAIAPGVPFSTPGVKADGKKKFGASFENWRGEAKTRSPGDLNVYCYHPEQRTGYGDHFFPNGQVMPNTSLPHKFGPQFKPRPALIPQLDRWYCFEVMVKANTPGQRDGRIGCWVDGKLIADFTNLRLRDTEALKINFAALDLHIHSNPTRANKKWYDDVVMATSYIGPMKK